MAAPSPDSYPNLNRYRAALLSAKEVRILSRLVLPGTLQVPEYANRVMQPDVPNADARAPHVDARMSLQSDTLDRIAKGLLRATVIVGEAALRPRADTRAEDHITALRHIVNLNKRHPGLTVQVLPDTAPISKADYTDTCQLITAEDGSQLAIRGGGPEGVNLYDHPDGVAWAKGVLGDARDNAMSPLRSAEFMGEMLADSTRKHWGFTA
jgi:hypothetical protein